MRSRVLWLSGLLLALLWGSGAPARAQLPQAGGPQIPTLQVCNATTVNTVNSVAIVHITSRAGVGATGNFGVRIALSCNPAGTGYPVGGLAIFGISMLDSVISGTIQASNTDIEQVSSTGKYSPTVYLNGRCHAVQITGCHFWMLIADNESVAGPGIRTPDVVSFLVFNATGQTVAYGTGPVQSGHIKVN